MAKRDASCNFCSVKVLVSGSPDTVKVKWTAHSCTHTHQIIKVSRIHIHTETLTLAHLLFKWSFLSFNFFFSSSLCEKHRTYPFIFGLALWWAYLCWYASSTGGECWHICLLRACWHPPNPSVPLLRQLGKCCQDGVSLKVPAFYPDPQTVLLLDYYSGS